ncbi:MAG TPA: hypothetical protein DCO75_04635 [Fibrobacteres bacterium]|nr:hypothetical protein [Fibrobacterota bacterium]
MISLKPNFGEHGDFIGKSGEKNEITNPAKPGSQARIFIYKIDYICRIRMTIVKNTIYSESVKKHNYVMILSR